MSKFVTFLKQQSWQIEEKKTFLYVKNYKPLSSAVYAVGDIKFVAIANS